MNYLHQNKNILFIDLEMSGAFSKKNKQIEVFEIAMLFAKGFNHVNYGELEEFHKFAKPRTPITYHVEKMTGVTNDMVASMPHATVYKDKIQEYINTSDLIVVHGGKLDTAALAQLGVDLKGKEIFDTATMMKRLFPYEKKTNLTYVCQLFGIDFNNAHSALADVYATVKLFVRLTDLSKKEWESLLLNKKLMTTGFSYTYNN